MTDYMREYNSRPEVKKRKQEWAEKNREKRRESNRKWERKNKDKIKERKRNYRIEYRQRPEVKEATRRRKQRPEYKEKQRAYQREYLQRPEVKDRRRVTENERYHRMGGRGHQRHFAALLQRDGPICGICKGHLEPTDDIHVDHIQPISKGGTSDFSNLQLAHAFCNVSKHAKWDGDEVAQSPQICLFDAVKE